MDARMMRDPVAPPAPPTAAGATLTQGHGEVIGWADGNTEVLVKWDHGGETVAKAGKRETAWDLAVVA